MGSLEHYLPIQNELGETPIWVPEEKALYWVDIGTHTIYRVDPATAAYESFKPDMPVRGLCRRTEGGDQFTNTRSKFGELNVLVLPTICHC